MRIIAPTVLVEQELSSTLTIKLEGIYNAISGASPTGAPPTPSTPNTGTAGGYGGIVVDHDRHDDWRDEGEKDEKEDGRRLFHHLNRPYEGRYIAKAGATPPPGGNPPPGGGGSSTPPPGGNPPPRGGGSSTGRGGGVNIIDRTQTAYDKKGKVPKARLEDERVGIILELTKRLDRHTIASQFSFSQESDYASLALALRDSMDFNRKNTTITLGAAYSMDKVDAQTMARPQSKTSADVLVGITQLLDKRTTLTLNLQLGSTQGYLADPYKVVELNGTLVPEKRPDTKTKQVVYLSLNRFIEDFNGAAEISYRLYNDAFGIRAHTLGLGWYQKIGTQLVLRPSIRWYTQTAADFYEVRFTGTPEFYSSDYRLSEMNAWGYGVKLIWSPLDRVSFDLSVDRYVQHGQDGVTADDMYPRSIALIAGIRVWL